MATEIDRTTILHVKGMTCGHCVSSVTEEIGEIANVKNVAVKLDTEGVSKVLVVSDVLIDDGDFRDAIEEAGYELVAIERD